MTAQCHLLVVGPGHPVLRSGHWNSPDIDYHPPVTFQQTQLRTSWPVRLVIRPNLPAFPTHCAAAWESDLPSLRVMIILIFSILTHIYNPALEASILMKLFILFFVQLKCLVQIYYLYIYLRGVSQHHITPHFAHYKGFTRTRSEIYLFYRLFDAPIIINPQFKSNSVSSQSQFYGVWWWLCFQKIWLKSKVVCTVRLEALRLSNCYVSRYLISGSALMITFLLIWPCQTNIFPGHVETETEWEFLFELPRGVFENCFFLWDFSPLTFD